MDLRENFNVNLCDFMGNRVNVNSRFFIVLEFKGPKELSEKKEFLTI